MRGVVFSSLVATSSAFARAPTSRRATSLSNSAEYAELAQGEHNFVIGILGDLHVDPRDLEQTYEGRDHMNKIFAEGPEERFLVSLGDLGESKDCTQTQQLFAGTTPCFKLVRDYLDGFDSKFDVVGGNHDLEGIDEFQTDKENLDAYLSILGKETPQFCHQVAEKTLVVGLGSTVFRDATYTSHEVFVDAEQVKWFKNVVATHPAEDDWKIFCFSHAPIIGSGLRVLQECHVVNGCCWLNHNGGPGAAADTFINVIRESPQIKAWFSGHFHLGQDYEDSITFPGGNNRGSCVFAQTAVMTDRSTRDGRRQSRFVRGNENGFEICTIDHAAGGVLRLDATVTYVDECEIDPVTGLSQACEVVTFAHAHEDYNHDLWFSAYTPEKDDGCYIADASGILNPAGSEFEDLSNPKTVCWWHMKTGNVLGAHNGMIIEYDPGTLAPLGMVVSRDELMQRRVAVIDDGFGGDALVLYDDDGSDATVIQPNEDGSFWRKIVRNKMHRMREQRRVKAAANFIKDTKQLGDGAKPTILSSYGPYMSTIGQVFTKNDLDQPAISTKAFVSKI